MSNNIEMLDNTPDSDLLWKGIGGYFDSLGEILCEFIDNSISNIRKHKLTIRAITINIQETQKDIKITVEDSGTGILKLAESFTLGSQSCGESPLNEHGFGFKHALASANPDNNDWTIITQTLEDRQQGFYRKITAPYKLSNQLVERVYEPWKGSLGQTGTIISFSCSKDMFYTIRRGISGGRTFNNTIPVLLEDLGFIYSGVLKQDAISITIKGVDENGVPSFNILKPIEPRWSKYVGGAKDSSEKVDLGNGNVDIQYTFGRIDAHPDTYKYYKKNMGSSGVEIRINGRILAYNLFKEIWGLENHPSYNEFLAVINVVSDDGKKLPKTKTSKNGLREGDSSLEELIAWISKKLPSDSIPKNNKLPDEDRDEVDLFEELKKAKEIHIPGNPIVETQLYAYKNLNEKIRMDLYIDNNNEVTIYEGKKEKTRLLDLYQLLMYWDGFVYDNPHSKNSVKEGILIASEHPDSLREIIPYINQMKDQKGNNYNIVLKTWKEEGIDYPRD